MDRDTFNKFRADIIERIKERYPQGYIYFDTTTVRQLKRIHRRYKMPETKVLLNSRKILADAMKTDASIGYKGGRFSHNIREPF